MIEKPKASISELTFSGGSTFQFKPTEKIIIVGPNNSGKSKSLREISEICGTGKKEHTCVIKELTLLKDGDSENLKAFLENKAEYVSGSYRYNSWQLHENQIGRWNQDYLTAGLLSGYIKNIAANDRLNICEQQSSIASGDQKQKPQHVMYDDEELMGKISSLFKSAFGKELMFDFRGGSKLPIHVGDLPKISGGNDRVSNQYVTEIRKNPLLDKQGDGMKGYAGILFEAVVDNLNITMIDEPEAFLHPPQMRKLGETLSSEVNGQLIVATHSSDILRGFLEGTQGKVRILRISRVNDVNSVSEAPAQALKELWEKPDLRYSNALEGIFHEQTIICEDDSDCRLINSIADFISTDLSTPWKDTAYVPTGGKHAIPKVANVLRQIGVPVKAVFDIDFLSESSLVKSAVSAFGGDWSQINPLWSRLNSAINKGIKPKTSDEIKNDIVSIIGESNNGDLPKGPIIEALKQGTSWNLVKKNGYLAIPHGNAQADFKVLREKLEEIGIYIVHVGEAENFCPEVGSHGPKFVTKLLLSIPLDDDRLEELRKFVKQVHIGPHSKL